MKVTVIGTGRMGKGLVKVLNGHVQNLQWGSRSIEKVKGMIQENGYANVLPVDHDEALDSEIIIHALWFRDLIPWAKDNIERLRGKIVVDIVNPFTEDFADFTTDWGTSAAEELQKTLPESKIVGAFKNTFFKVLENPIHEGLQSDVYVTSNDETAKNIVMEVLKTVPFRILDGGSLINNRTIERMTLFEREVAIRYGNYPYIAFRMFGINK